MTCLASIRVCLRTLVSATALLAAALTLSGCAATGRVATNRMHSSALSQMNSVQTTAVVPPEITLHQLSAGGVREQRDDWTEAARANARATLEQMRPERMVYLRDVALPPEIAAELEEVKALYRTIDANITLFGNPMVGLPTALGRFDYSVGSVDKICEAVDADALLLIYGEDDYFTGSRKFMTGLGVVASIAATAVTGTGVMVTPSSGTEHLSAALIARDGTLIWYEVLGPGRLGDLREPEGLRTTIENLLSSMPDGQAKE
ncbi:MAG: hypothetical protein IAE82_04350 [Opitutaceae bacterium]|nr:hypothetical protein [Opitutaceae bacterium]